jgi:hypothetical protein
MDFKPTEIQAPGPGLTGLIDNFGGVQQGFRRNAPAIKTHATGVHLRVNQGNFQSEVGSQKRSGIPAGATPDYCQMSFFNCH